MHLPPFLRLEVRYDHVSLAVSAAVYARVALPTQSILQSQRKRPEANKDG